MSRENPSTKKDVKNEGRTDYVFENKDVDDNLPDTYGNISASCMPFYMLFPKNLSALFSLFHRGEEIPRFKM